MAKNWRSVCRIFVCGANRYSGERWSSMQILNFYEAAKDGSLILLKRNEDLWHLSASFQHPLGHLQWLQSPCFSRFFRAGSPPGGTILLGMPGGQRCPFPFPFMVWQVFASSMPGLLPPTTSLNWFNIPRSSLTFIQDSVFRLLIWVAALSKPQHVFQMRYPGW